MINNCLKMKSIMINFHTFIVIVTLFLTFICNCITSGIKAKANYKDDKINPVYNTAADSNTNNPDSSANNDKSIKSLPPLSAASLLLVKACENYLTVNPESPKSAEVLTIIASLYYNSAYFEQSRNIYKSIIDKFAGTSGSSDAMKMIAQSYYEEKNFTEAQNWYRKISDSSPDSINKQEAIVRIAESIFRMAESYEGSGRLNEAAENYERTALEFPESKIADVALFNAGLVYEKQAEWSHAILIFQRLLQKYSQSKLTVKAQFRIARSHEKLLQWETAAHTYLRVVANFPKDELAQTAIYNAGFCFENSDLQQEAAATFEKMAQLFPNSNEAADVLFRAGEIYGKLKDWQSVGRVNKIFASRYGNDKDRIIQVQCMTGIALYMQTMEKEALEQLEKTLSIYASLTEPSTMNTYYAAKAMFTIGEIIHESMNKITLPGSGASYKNKLAEKSNLLEQAANTYGKVIQFKIMEWTTRAIFQLGQMYEDFAIGIFKQERSSKLSVSEQLNLELGIAQAVEQYFVTRALHYHEQNVKIALKENIENKFVLLSRKKLTYLPFTAAENYLKLAEIYQKSQDKGQLDGFALIASRLKTLQQIAPYQERAIDLLLKSLEMGSTYQEKDDFFKNAFTSITGISFVVGETYSDIVTIARDAPIPSAFDKYEAFVYKTKLIKQIEEYENQALTHYLKTLKISDIYNINDESVQKSREQIAKTLFYKARCYDLLCLSVFNSPPYPPTINEAEKDEYKIRFEEIGLKFQEQSFDIYRSILTYAAQNYSSGPFVTHAYVRLFQNFPDEFGVKIDELVHTKINSDNNWTCTTDSILNWNSFDFNDSSWNKVHFTDTLNLDSNSSLSASTSQAMWYGNGDPAQLSTYVPAQRVFFRRIFSTQQIPRSSSLTFAGSGISSLFINGQYLLTDTSKQQSQSIDLMGKIRNGKNAICIEVNRNGNVLYGIKPMISFTIGSVQSHPKPPGHQQPLTINEVRFDVYKFPVIKNFEIVY